MKDNSFIIIFPYAINMFPCEDLKIAYVTTYHSLRS